VPPIPLHRKKLLTQHLDLYLLFKYLLFKYMRTHWMRGGEQ
jgi:hypothetical protein